MTLFDALPTAKHTLAYAHLLLCLRARQHRRIRRLRPAFSRVVVTRARRARVVFRTTMTT